MTAALLPLAGPTLEGQQRLPEILYISDPDIQFPAWVSAAAAIDPHGNINERLFPAPLRSTIESYFAEPIDGYWSNPQTGSCYHVEEYFVSRIDPPDRSSLDRAARNSGFVFIGRITAAAYGFHFDIPGQLFRIEPGQVLHGEALLDFYYIFYPVGEFSAGLTESVRPTADIRNPRMSATNC